MLRRFAAAAVVSSAGIAVLSIALFLIKHSVKLHATYLLTEIWCCIPLVWGVWAMLAPPSWVPKRLPQWGAILGAFAGVAVAIVVNLPMRILAQPVGRVPRAIGAILTVAIYYVMWMVVRAAYVHLLAKPDTKETKATSASAA